MSPSRPSITDAPLSEVDPEVAAAITAEVGRQRDTLEMIASENFAPRAVLEAQGSVLTCSGPSTPTCSRTRAPRPTRRSWRP